MSITTASRGRHTSAAAGGKFGTYRDGEGCTGQLVFISRHGVHVFTPSQIRCIFKNYIITFVFCWKVSLWFLLVHTFEHVVSEFFFPVRRLSALCGGSGQNESTLSFSPQRPGQLHIIYKFLIFLFSVFDDVEGDLRTLRRGRSLGAEHDRLVRSDLQSALHQLWRAIDQRRRVQIFNLHEASLPHGHHWHPAALPVDQAHLSVRHWTRLAYYSYRSFIVASVESWWKAQIRFDVLRSDVESTG